MEHFAAHRLRFVVEARTPIYLRVHKGSALRGGLFHALRSRFCLDGSFSRRTACRDCQLRNSCPICFLVATVDEASERGIEVPRPYVIEPPLDGKTEYRPGEVWEFGLTMFDRALNLFPYVILGVQQLGEDGLGSGRGRFQVREVWAQNPLTSMEQRLAHWEDRLVSVPSIPVTHQQVLERADALTRSMVHAGLDACHPERSEGSRLTTEILHFVQNDKAAVQNDNFSSQDCHPAFGDCHPKNHSDCHPESSRCHPEFSNCHPERSEGSRPTGEILHFVQNDNATVQNDNAAVQNDLCFALTLNLKTPLRLVKEGRLVHRLDFATLVARLFERLTALSSTYSSSALALPFRDLLTMADGVAVVEDETEWLELDRYSSRQKRPLPMGGLVGKITFRGDLIAFLPWLLWGQYTHLGKMATMGNGWYEVGVRG